MFKAKSHNPRFATNTTAGYRFVMTGKIAASGPIGSIIDPTLPDNIDIISTYTFARIFTGCSSLVEAPELNVRSINGKAGTFYGMFASCDNLVDAPSLSS